MDCATARVAISALVDGEACGVSRSALEDHLSTCSACCRWQEGAHELTRQVRLQPATPAICPPVGLSGAGRASRPTGWWRRTTAPRIGLVIVAATQLALSVPAILYGHDHSAPVHLAHEMGSFDVAVAVGLLVAAYRPGRSVGMLSLLGAAAALLVVTASVDLVAGRTSVGDESPHVLVVAGWLLVRWLAAVVPPTFERPGGMLHGLRAAADAVARLGRQPGGRPEAPSVGYGDEIVASLSSSALWKPDVRKGGEALPGHRAAG